MVNLDLWYMDNNRTLMALIFGYISLGSVQGGVVNAFNSIIVNHSDNTEGNLIQRFPVFTWEMSQ